MNIFVTKNSLIKVLKTTTPPRHVSEFWQFDVFDIASSFGAAFLLTVTLAIFMSIKIASSDSLQAATMPIADVPLGGVISINGQQFTKVSDDNDFAALKSACSSVNANCLSCSNLSTCTVCTANYLPSGGDCDVAGSVVPNCTASDGTACTVCANGYTPASGKCYRNANSHNNTTMQAFTTAMCNEYKTPTAAGYTLVATIMKDARDGKSYEVRKFADGKCWMASNLMYGGGTDGSSDYCTGKSTFRDARSVADTTAIASNGLNPTNGTRNTLVGDCRDPRVGCVIDPHYNTNTSCICTAGSTACGYLYNWAATIQDANGWYDNSFQPTEPTQGICPQGWHLPTGGSGGEYEILDIANGGTGAYQSSCTTASCNFWRPGNAFNGIYAGLCWQTGGLNVQGSSGHYWSSTQPYGISAYYLNFNSGSVGPSTYVGPKFDGFSVRCIKD